MHDDTGRGGAARGGFRAWVLGGRIDRWWGSVFDVLLLGTRLFAGLWMMGAGLDKLPTPGWMVDQVVFVGFPMPEVSAFCASLTEFAGGLLLALGLLTRPAAFFLAFTMGVAVYFHHKKDGIDLLLDWHMTKQFFWTYVALLAAGPGMFSIDAVLHAVFTRRGEDGGKRLRFVPAVVTGLALASPIVGYGVWRELTMEWEDPNALTESAEEVAIESMSVAGSFNGWDLTATPMQRAEEGVWRAEAELAPGPVAFKFAANGAWDINVGEADQGTGRFPIEGVGEAGSENIEAYAPDAGRYVFTLDEATLAYTFGALDADLDAEPDSGS